jgi:hypothetical protein
MLEGDEILVENFYAVYNPMLTNAFALTLEKVCTTKIP